MAIHEHDLAIGCLAKARQLLDLVTVEIAKPLDFDNINLLGTQPIAELRRAPGSMHKYRCGFDILETAEIIYPNERWSSTR